jgi:cysteine desulfurase/selenocysteine lyase
MSTKTEPLIDISKVRADFPILSERPYGKRLIYLDSAATAQKPHAVIDAVGRYYSEANANVNRASHFLAAKATDAYETARSTVSCFINAPSVEEIVFTRGTTESINLVAQTFGRANLREGDEIVLSQMEHHANLVPWQLVAQERGAILKFVPIDERGDLCLDRLREMVGERTKIVSITHVSNVLGTINPVAEIVRLAHEAGAAVMLDGAQAVPHMSVDVSGLDCDFYTFSGHKLYGPTGIGVLYGKANLLDKMPPYQAGGDMITSVSFDSSSFKTGAHKFEAGTPNIAGAIGLAAAIDYLNSIGMDTVKAWDAQLLEHATELLSGLPGLRIFGTSKEKAGVISFALDCAHPHDIATILDREGIAIRAGHHCAQPLMGILKEPATARASFGIYNDFEDTEALAVGLRKVAEIFG